MPEIPWFEAGSDQCAVGSGNRRAHRGGGRVGAHGRWNSSFRPAPAVAPTRWPAPSRASSWHGLMKQSMVVINKSGGAGGEGLPRRQGLARQSTQDRHHAEPVHHAARHRHSVQLEGPHAGRDAGARRIHPLGECGDAYKSVKDYVEAVKKSPASSRWAAPAPSRKIRSSRSPREGDRQPSSPISRSAAAARSPCSWSASTSIDRQQSDRGRGAVAGEFGSAALRVRR